MRCNVVPYEGSEPYIFISYAHRDGERVFPVIERLAADGFRIWYDEGIDPGSEWISNIGQHLATASAVITFLSANSVASQNCREEIMFARDEKIPILAIHLEDLEIDRGLKLALMSYQAVFKHAYDDENQFFSKVESASMLGACREIIESEPEPEPDSAVASPIEQRFVGEPKTEPPTNNASEAAPLAAKPEPITPATPEPIPEAAHTAATSTSAASSFGAADHDASAQPTEPAPKSPSKGKLIGIIAGAAAVIVLVAIFALGGGGSQSTASKSAQSVNPTSSTTPAAANSEQSQSASDATDSLSAADIDRAAIEAVLTDPDGHRGETITFYAEMSMAADSYKKYFEGTLYRLQVSKDSSNPIYLPESEQSLVTGTLDKPRYVRVTGTIDTVNGIAFLKGAELTDATFIDYATPTLKSVSVGVSVAESGVTFTVDKVEFAEAETRVYYTVKNNRSKQVEYDEPTIVQGNSNYTEDHYAFYADVNSNAEFKTKCPTDSSISGFVEYPPMGQSTFTATLKMTWPTEIRDTTLSVEVPITD